MSARAAAGLLVSALIRRIEAEGGHAMVLAKGDATAGAIMLVLANRGETLGALERALDARGRYAWGPAGPADAADLTDYIARRRRSDPDLWVVELDHPRGAEIATEVLS